QPRSRTTAPGRRGCRTHARRSEAHLRRGSRRGARGHVTCAARSLRFLQTGGEQDHGKEPTRMGMGNLQRMAMQMQQEMARVQAELESATVDASAGGGAVRATVTGKQDLVGLAIDPSAVDPDDVEMLQDLVMTAVNDALRASRELAEQKMGAVTAGLRIP